MHLKPAFAQNPEHAHGLNGFGVVQMTGGQLAGFLRIATGFTQRLFGHGFVETRQRDQQQRTGRGQHAEPGIEHKDHEQIDRKPRCVEEGEQRRSRDELANVREIPQRLPGIALALEQVAFERGPVDPQVETALQLAADPDDDEAADDFQQTDKREKPDHHQGQHGQGGFVLRREHPVIDLKHINRRY